MIVTSDFNLEMVTYMIMITTRKKSDTQDKPSKQLGRGQVK